MPLYNRNIVLVREDTPADKITGSESMRGVLGTVTLGMEQRLEVPDVSCTGIAIPFGTRAYPYPQPTQQRPFPDLPPTGDPYRVDPQYAGRGGLEHQVTRR